MEVMPDHIHLLVDLISKDRKKKKQESKEVLMKVVSSYGVEIKKQNIPLRHTLHIYRQTVSQSLYMKIMQCRYDGVKESVKSAFIRK